MGKIKKMTPEERTRQEENQRRLEQIVRHRLAEEATDPAVQERRRRRESS